MKRRLKLLVKVIAVGLVLLPISTFAQPKILNIGTHPVGTFFNVVGNSIGAVISKHAPLRAKVMPVGISSWMPRMVTGEMDLGVLNSTDARWAYFGLEHYKKMSKGRGFPIRLLLTGICNDVSIVVRGDLPVEKPSQLKGLRIAAGFSKAPACQLHPTAVLANGGLTWDDVKLVPVPAPGAAVRAVIEGRADAAGSATTGMPAVEELAAKRGARFISLDPSPEAKARTLRIYPDGWFNLVKGGTYTGVDKDSWLLRYEIYIVARKDLPDEIVRTILETLWDHHSELQNYHKKFKEWSREGYASKKLVIPYHPAAVKFLKERGLWTKELDLRQKELLAKKR